MTDRCIASAQHCGAWARTSDRENQRASQILAGCGGRQDLIHSVDHARSGAATRDCGQLERRARRAEHSGAKIVGRPAQAGGGSKRRTIQDPRRVGQKARSHRASNRPQGSGIEGAQKFPQHIYSSLLVSTEAGTKTHSMLDNMPSDNRQEAWRRLTQSFDPAGARTSQSKPNGQDPEAPQGKSGPPGRKEGSTRPHKRSRKGNSCSIRIGLTPTPMASQPSGSMLSNCATKLAPCM